MMKRLPQVISRDDFDRLISRPSKTASDRPSYGRLIAAMYDCGLRVSEVCNLAPGDLIRTGTNAQSRQRVGPFSDARPIEERRRFGYASTRLMYASRLSPFSRSGCAP